MKTCRKCGEIKNSKRFFASNICKKCGERYPKRLLRVILEAQVTSSRKRGLPLPTYNYKEFTSWVLAQPNFREIYTAWVKSKYDTKLRPSIDRIKEWESYSIDNIQLMTWGENKLKGEQDCKEGRRYSQIKSVCRFSLDEEFDTQYFSLHEAGRDTGIKFNAIASAVAHSKLKNYAVFGRSGGYRWVDTLGFIRKSVSELNNSEYIHNPPSINYKSVSFDEDRCYVTIKRVV